MATEIEALLDYALNIGASEVIVSEGLSPAVRLAGRVCTIPDAPIVESGSIVDFLGGLETESGSMVGGPWVNTHWRVRYFREARGLAAVFRPILEQCPDFSALGITENMNNLLGFSSGLVVFGGPACSGKTTTASAYVSTLCSSRMLRASFVGKEELNINAGESLVLKDSTAKIETRMDQALRSGTDLFWMGDFERENLLPMLAAAEAGSLVVVNVTAGNSVGVLEALLSASAPEMRALVRTMLAAVLKAVVVQRLLPTADEKGIVPAWEVLYNTQNVATHIRNGEHFKLPSIIASSASEGMLLMDDCLAELVRTGYVNREDAGKYVSNPARLG
jgi:twitching motility protein PilT